MRRRIRTVLLAFVAALLAIVFVLPFVQGKRCRDTGGRYDRTTFTCHPG